MSEPRALTAADVRALLGGPGGTQRTARGAPGEPGKEAPTPARWSLREALCLLGSFDEAAPERVAHGAAAGGPGELSSALRALLRHDCDRVSTRAGRRLRLRAEVRAAALERLRTPRRMREALSRAPEDPSDPARAWAGRLLAGDLPDGGGDGLAELHAALTVTGWFAGAPRAREALALHGRVLPDTGGVRARIEVARLVQPLSALAGEGFVGRRRELRALAAHARVPAAGAPGGSGTDRSSRLMVHGPGGIGKSSLVARFVLDHVGPGPTVRLPFAYLSFDRADLLPQQPLTLLAEAARQLGVLRPAVAAEARAVAVLAHRTLLADRTAEDESSRTLSGRRGGHDRDERRLVERFARLVAAAAPPEAQGPGPVLLVLDTLEIAQRHGATAMARLTHFLDALQDACPQVRVVLAGRAPLDDASRRTRRLTLSGFEPALALGFLREHIGSPAVPVDEAFLSSVVTLYGTNPLSLKLTAELVRRLGPEGLTDAAARRELTEATGAEQLQGMLYRRILDHLDGEDLRRIANPGLAVRRVTPEVIRKVLAGPCGLGPVDWGRAEDLFAALKAEASLVEPAPDGGAVVQRHDVRGAMLPLLRRDSAAQVREIDRLAVEYYAAAQERRPDRAVELRAEELYHRLALEQEAAVLDGRWLDEAGPLLDSALDELPERSRVYLSDRLGITVPAALRERADEVTWARQAAREAQALLGDGRPEQALALVSERPGVIGHRPELAVLRLRALAALGRAREVRASVGAALDAAAARDPALTGEIALLGARAEEDLGDFGAAHALLRRVRRAAEQQGDRVLALRALTASLRLHRRGGSASSPAAEEVRGELVAGVAAAGDRTLERHPSLLRDLAAELGDRLPRLVALAVRVLGVDFEGPMGRQLSLRLTAHDVPGSPGSDPGGPGGDGDRGRERGGAPGGGPEPDGAPGEGRRWPGSGNSLEQGARVSAILGAGDTRRDVWNDALVDAYRHEADRASPLPSSGRPGPSVTWDAVVVVPGLLGSVLRERETGRLLWGGQPSGLVRDWCDGTAAEALRVADEERAGASRTVAAGLVGSPVWAPRIGGCEPYGPLLGAVRERVVHPDAVLEFPYDWRLAVERSGRLLAGAARRHLRRWRARAEALRAPGAGPGERRPPRLVLVAHSQGGLVARAALEADPDLARDTRVLVTLGTPFDGAPAVAAFLGDRGDGPPGHERFHAAALTMPGLYDLLPRTACVERDGRLTALTAADLAAAGADADLAAAALAPRAAGAGVRRPDHRGVAGTGQPTVQSLLLAAGRVLALEDTLRTRPDGSVTRDPAGAAARWDRGGDGLVPRDAAAWEGSPVEQCYVTARHGALHTHPVALRYVARVLTETPGVPVDPAEVGGVVATSRDVAPPGAARTDGVLAAIGLPGTGPAVGLRVPERVAPGRPWTLRVTGPAALRGIRCAVQDAATGRTVVTPRLRGTEGGLEGSVVLVSSGLYRVVVEREGAPPVTELVLAAAAAPAAWPPGG
ncbi:AAA family ATPase [Streptomyces sp. C10-9-1]|uniref:AAA family ATPase n=1 Tax=Streptomyces sp. C10-9-1 TaxID=1859285 RepID=UPI00211224F8|nr:AAA family ATPase [Streptomyces sp. C10-9-1]MCQ6553288.1 AAA family ATPase [Streptomyces sp. C10-9-1]